jgi:hypothetical protein
MLEVVLKERKIRKNSYDILPLILYQIPITSNGRSEMDKWLECLEMRFKTQVGLQVNQTLRIMTFRRVNELWVFRRVLPESWYVANLSFFDLWKAFYCHLAENFW